METTDKIPRIIYMEVFISMTVGRFRLSTEWSLTPLFGFILLVIPWSILCALGKDIA